VLLHLYERDGTAMLERLNGMFAFALHDRRSGRLLLARDRLGEKPLYLYEDAERIVFASEIKAILALPDVPAEPDPQALQEYLTFQYCLGERTLFKGILRLPPATYLTLGAAGERARGRYWELAFDEDDGRATHQVVGELRALLEDSVRLRLRSDVPTGYLLSGGLDSTLVAALGRGGRPAFTASVDGGPAYDELPYAAAAAAAIGSSNHVVRVEPQALAELLPVLVRQLDEPAAGPAAFPMHLVSALARERVGVVLGGHGGDELFAGYARYQLMAPGAAEVEGYAPLAEDFRRARTGDPVHDYFTLISRSPQLDRYLTPELWHARDEEALFTSFATEFDAPLGQAPRASLLTRMRAYDLRVGLQSLLHVEDRMTMAHSLEARQPLLDHRIVELAFRIPSQNHYLGNRPKGILLAAVRDVVAEEVLRRTNKMGLPVPWVEWARGPLAEFVREVLLGPRTRARGLYEPEPVAELIRSERVYGRALWGLVCLELWFREFIDR
jgi:asparagine synthase (glutamine-hydrolysing)